MFDDELPVRVEWMRDGEVRHAAELLVGEDPDVSEVIRSTGRFHEDDLLAEIAGFDLDDGLFVEVGAGPGHHSVFFAGALGRTVLAFEPDRRRAERFAANVRLNDLGDRVSIRSVGLLDERAWHPIDVGAVESNTTLLADDGNPAVYFAPLDDFVPAASTVALVVIGVRKTQVRVLRGAEIMLRRDRPVIVVAASNDRTHQHEVVELLDGHGYVPLPLLGRSDKLVFAHPARHGALISAGNARIDASLDAARSDRSSSMTGAVDSLIVEFERFRTLAGLKSSQLELARRANDQRATEARRAEAQLEAAFKGYSRLYYELLNEEQQVQEVRPREQRKRVRAVDVGEPDPPADEPKSLDRDLFPYLSTMVERDRPVRVGLAAIPSREASLKLTVASLVPQVDELCISLNGFDRIPDWLSHEKVHAVLTPDGGDHSKFMFLDEDFSGWYLTCDDDIAYPPFYVNSILYYLEKYDGRCAVGWHGSSLQADSWDYYDFESRDVHTFRSRQTEEVFVQFLGTGCMGFDCAHVRLPSDTFKSPSMADVYFAMFAQEQALPLLLIPHGARQARDLGGMLGNPPSISGDSIARNSGAGDVRDEVNALIASRRWVTHEL
jgi:FkbM family methyltransferase